MQPTEEEYMKFTFKMKRACDKCAGCVEGELCAAKIVGAFERADNYDPNDKTQSILPDTNKGGE